MPNLLESQARAPNRRKSFSAAWKERDLTSLSVINYEHFYDRLPWWIVGEVVLGVDSFWCPWCSCTEMDNLNPSALIGECIPRAAINFSMIKWCHISNNTCNWCCHSRIFFETTNLQLKDQPVDGYFGNLGSRVLLQVFINCWRVESGVCL